MKSISSQKNPKKKIAQTKPQNRAMMLDYLGNPENPVPTRTQLAVDVLGYKDPSSMYALFTPADLDEIEAEALVIRRARLARCSMRVDHALVVDATKANADAATRSLYYKRLEGWREELGLEMGAGNSLMALVASMLNAERQGGDALPPGNPAPVAPALAAPVADGDEEATP